MRKRKRPSGVKIIAKDCGITARQVWNLVRDKGMPQISPGKFDREAVREWWARYKNARGTNPDLRDAEIRVKTAQAELQELKLSAARGEFLPAALVIRAWDKATTSFRARMLAIPRKAVPRLRSTSGDASKEKLLREMIHEALHELAAADYAGIVDGAHADLVRGESEASAGSDSEPMGGRAPSIEPGKQRRARKVEHRSR